MSDIVQVSIPRWQWRTCAADLSWLVRRLPVPPTGPGRRIEEVHFVCLHSSHHAFVHADALKLRWRKELSPEGFEIWDTVLRARLPFQPADVARLHAAMGLSAPDPRAAYPTVGAFVDGVIAATPDVTAVRIVRQARDASFHGFTCSIETVEAAPPARFETFSIEHEDPSLMAQVLTELGLDARANINFLQGLRNALGLPAVDARNPTWQGKLNASIS